MKKNTRTWLLAGGVAAAMALAALIWLMNPGIITRSGLDDHDIGGGALAAVILWLVLRRQQPMNKKGRIVIGVAVGTGLLLGLAVFHYL